MYLFVFIRSINKFFEIYIASGYILEEVREGQIVEESKCKLTFLLQADFKTEIDSLDYIKECTAVVVGIKKFFKERGKINPNIKKARGRAGSFGRLKHELMRYSPNKIRRTPEKIEPPTAEGNTTQLRTLNYDEEDEEKDASGNNNNGREYPKGRRLSKSWQNFPLGELPHRAGRAMSVTEEEKPSSRSLGFPTTVVTSGSASARGSKTPGPVRVRSFTDYNKGRGDNKTSKKGAAKGKKNNESGEESSGGKSPRGRKDGIVRTDPPSSPATGHHPNDAITPNTNGKVHHN